MDNIYIIISNPNKNYIESQLLECIRITKNIIISFSINNNDEDFFVSIINKHNFKNVYLTPYEITDNIEFNPLSTKDNIVFWDNISRISALIFINNNNLSNNKPLWYLFINGNEIPNSFVFINFFENKVNNTDCSYIFINNIILVPSKIFSNDIDIYKNLMKNNKRLDTAKLISSNEIILPLDLFIII